MKRRPITILLLLLFMPFAAQAQAPIEILQAVGQGQGERIEGYNAAFLQLELHAAARHRIVRVNTNALLQEREITLTPFADVAPIRITPEMVRRTEDSVNWSGQIHSGEATYPFFLSLLAWDLDAAGNASASVQNRFQFSPLWRFDEFDQPYLEPAPGEDSGSQSPYPHGLQDTISQRSPNPFRRTKAKSSKPPRTRCRQEEVSDNCHCYPAQNGHATIETEAVIVKSRGHQYREKQIVSQR